MICFECDSPAEEQHHPIPQSLGGQRTIPLCSACHGKAHSVSRGSIPALTKRALQQRREAGVRLGRPATVDPAIFGRVIQLVDEGKSLNGIARLFNEEKVPTVRGGTQWYASTIWGIVKTHRLNLVAAEYLARSSK